MTCMAMCGNGVPMLGIAIMKARLRMEVLGKQAAGLLACSGVGVGTSMRGTCVLRIGTTARPPTGAATSGFASRGLFSF